MKVHLPCAALSLALMHVGQVLDYCIKMFDLDHTRKFLFVLVTDLDKCRLLKVKADILKPASERSAETVIQSTDFPWYNASLEEALGLKVLAVLGSMTDEELGINKILPVNLLANVKGCLGTGGTSAVFDMGDGSVLKVTLGSAKQAGSLELNAHMNERNALKALQRRRRVSPDASEPTTSFAGQQHLPKLVEYNEEMGKLTDRALLLRPQAVKLTLELLQAEHIDQLFDLLHWTHHSGWLHGDISYRNLMLAPSNWQATRSRFGQVC